MPLVYSYNSNKGRKEKNEDAISVSKNKQGAVIAVVCDGVGSHSNAAYSSNYIVATLEKDGQVTFLHKIEAGPADKSYGIHVAKIAGLPKDLLTRADAILTDLEGREDQKAIFDSDKSQGTLLRQDSMGQLDLFTAEHPVLETLRGLNLNQMTPMDALLLLSDLQKDL